MGQYYLAVNMDKMEYISPMMLGTGFKACELLHGETALPQLLAYLLLKSDEGGGGDLEPSEYQGRWAGDRIWIVGDYDSSGLFGKVDPEDTGNADISIPALLSMVESEPTTFLPRKYDGILGHKWIFETYEEEHPDTNVVERLTRCKEQAQKFWDN